MANLVLPAQTEPVVLPDGRINPVWYRFLKELTRIVNAGL